MAQFIVANNLEANIKNEQFKRSNRTKKINNTYSYVYTAFLYIVYILFIIWWVSIFVRVGQLQKKESRILVILINSLFSPLAGEISLQVLKK